MFWWPEKSPRVSGGRGGRCNRGKEDESGKSLEGNKSSGTSGESCSVSGFLFCIDRSFALAIRRTSSGWEIRVIVSIAAGWCFLQSCLEVSKFQRRKEVVCLFDRIGILFLSFSSTHNIDQHSFQSLRQKSFLHLLHLRIKTTKSEVRSPCCLVCYPSPPVSSFSNFGRIKRDDSLLVRPLLKLFYDDKQFMARYKDPPTID